MARKSKEWYQLATGKNRKNNGSLGNQPGKVNFRSAKDVVFVSHFSDYQLAQSEPILDGSLFSIEEMLRKHGRGVFIVTAGRKFCYLSEKFLRDTQEAIKNFLAIYCPMSQVILAIPFLYEAALNTRVLRERYNKGQSL